MEQKQRQVITPVTTETNFWLLDESKRHAETFTNVLSAARITRSVLAGLAAARAPIGAHKDAEDIERWVAHVFAHYAQTSKFSSRPTRKISYPRSNVSMHLNHGTRQWSSVPWTEFSE